MPMNPNFLCCIGAELKNSTQQTTRMSQVYFYRAFEEETVADMLQPGFFDAAMGIVRKDDLLLLYDPKDESARWTYCRVSNVDRSGVEISLMGINAKDVLVEISGEDPITLQSLIDNTIMPAIENIGDMDLPVITEGGTAPTNLSEAIRQIVTQNLTLTEDSMEPQSGQFSLWGAIKKALGNAKNFFSSISDLDSRLNALEGQGGPVGSYNFGKSFPNILDATDTQLVAGIMVDNIWAGHTPIVWATPITNSTFTDGDGVERTVGELFNGTWIINSYDGTRIVLTNTPNTTPPVFSYQNVGVYSVGFANTTTAGVVRVGSGSDMAVNQSTGDISIDDTKGYSIFHRLISLFTGTQKTQIREDLNAASRDMDDLSATGQNIANWSSNVSNCITYIPQDINISINTSNQLELASGSTVYLGGSTAVPISTTIKQTSTTLITGKYFIATTPTGSGIEVAGFSSAVSAASNPGTAYIMWFNTTDGKSYVNSSDGTAREISFPIAIASFTNGTGWTKVEQVFNGIGYLGSTIFVLPGLEYLCPNGRNSDGSLKNIRGKLSQIHFNSVTSGANGYVCSSINNAGTMTQDYLSLWVTQDEEPTGVNYLVWYCPKLNKTYQYISGAWEDRQRCVIGTIHITSGKIDELNPKTAFEAVDYSNTAFIAHQAMPSGKYSDLTLGASGSTYTAPADGYFYLRKSGTAQNQYIYISGGGLSQDIFCPLSTGGTRSIWLPVKKRTVVTVSYNADGTTSVFRFIYAEGVKE